MLGKLLKLRVMSSARNTGPAAGSRNPVVSWTSAASRCRLRQVRSAEARYERLFPDEKGSVLRLRDL